jgi:hypothetical protein
MEFEEELDPHSEEYYQRAFSFIGEDLAAKLYEAAIQALHSPKFATKEEEEKYIHTSDDIYHHRKLDDRRRVCDAYFTTMRVMLNESIRHEIRSHLSMIVVVYVMHTSRPCELCNNESIRNEMRSHLNVNIVYIMTISIIIKL